MFLLAITYTMFDVVKAKPTLLLHIVGGVILLLRALVHGSRGAKFSTSDLVIAQKSM